MFIPSDSRPATSLRPSKSAISPNDWAALADFWYPIALTSEVRQAPVKATLLDVDLVLFRSASHSITAALDMCPHRHVRLSAGRVVDGEIECPFHGLRFDATGKCQYVPALGKRMKLPDNYRVQTFPVQERYGLVWTCIGNGGKATVPHLPTLADRDPETLSYGKPSVWPISAPRQIENFIDLAHLPIVHKNTLGGDAERAVKPGDVEHTEDAVVLRARYVESRPDGKDKPVTMVYRIVLPFSVDFTVFDDAKEDPPFLSSNFASPTSAYQTKVFQVHAMEGPEEMRQSFLDKIDTVNNEDIAMLRNVATDDMPLTQHFEIHLPVDNICLAFRNRLRDFGIGRGVRGESPEASS